MRLVKEVTPQKEDRIKFSNNQESGFGGHRFTKFRFRLFKMNLLPAMCQCLILSSRHEWNSLPLRGAQSWQRHLSRGESGCAGNPSLTTWSLSWNLENDEVSAKRLQGKERRLVDTGDAVEERAGVEQAASPWPSALHSSTQASLLHSSNSLKTHLYINLSVSWLDLDLFILWCCSRYYY